MCSGVAARLEIETLAESCALHRSCFLPWNSACIKQPFFFWILLPAALIDFPHDCCCSRLIVIACVTDRIRSEQASFLSSLAEQRAAMQAFLGYHPAQ